MNNTVKRVLGLIMALMVFLSANTYFVFAQESANEQAQTSPQLDAFELVDPTSYSSYENGTLVPTGTNNAELGFEHGEDSYGKNVSWVKSGLTFIYENVYFEEAPYDFTIYLGTHNNNTEKVEVYIDGVLLETLDTTPSGVNYKPSPYTARVSGLEERSIHVITVVILQNGGVNLYGFQFSNYEQKNGLEFINGQTWDSTSGKLNMGTPNASLGFTHEKDDFGVPIVSYITAGTKFEYKNMYFEEAPYDFEIRLGSYKNNNVKANVYIDGVKLETLDTTPSGVYYTKPNSYGAVLPEGLIKADSIHEVTIEIVSEGINFSGFQFRYFEPIDGNSYIEPTSYSYHENGSLASPGTNDAFVGFEHGEDAYGKKIWYAKPNLTFVYKNVYFEKAPHDFVINLATLNNNSEKVKVYIDGVLLESLDTTPSGTSYDIPSQYVTKVTGIEAESTHEIAVVMQQMGVNYYGFQFKTYEKKDGYSLIDPHKYDSTTGTFNETGEGDSTVGFRKENIGEVDGLENCISYINTDTEFTYRNVYFDRSAVKLILYAGYEATSDNLNKIIKVTMDDGTELATVTTVDNDDESGSYKPTELSVDVTGKISARETHDITVKFVDSSVNFFGMIFIPTDVYEPDIPDGVQPEDIEKPEETVEDEYRDPYVWVDITSYDELKGPNKNLGVYDGPSIQYTDPKTYIKYGNYNFTSSPLGVEAKITKGLNEYHFEIRADGPEGLLIATIEGSGGHSNWATVDTFTANLSKEITGVHDIYIVVPTYNVNLYGFRFTGVNSMDIVGLTPDTSSEINPYIRNITVEFSNYIDESTVAENVMLEDESGDPVDLRFETNGKNLNIKFGTLTFDTEYTLDILGGLKSVNGYSIQPKTYTYTVGSESKYKIAESFSTEITGSQPTDSQYIEYSGSAVVGEENGKKYVAVSSENTQSGSIKLLLNYELDATTYLDIYYKVKILDGNAVCLGTESSDAAVLDASGITSGDLSYNITDENGFYDVNLTVRKVLGKYVVSMYDPSSKKVNTICQSDVPQEIFELPLVSVTQDKAAVTDISCNLSSFNISEHSAGLNDINIHGLEIVFNEAVNAETIKELRLMESTSGRLIEYTYTLSGDEKTLTVHPKVFLLAGAEYTIDFSDVENIKCINNPFGVLEIMTKSNPITVSNPKKSVYTTLNIAKFEADILVESGSFIVICKIYDENGKVKDIESGKALPLYVEDITKEEWERAEISIWHLDNNYIAPILTFD